MSFLARFLGGPMASADVSGTGAPEQWLVDIFGGMVTASGFRVSVRDARSVPGIQACIRVFGDDLSKVPLALYRRKRGGGREVADYKPQHKLVKFGPAPWLSSHRWRRVLWDACLAHGNAFSKVVRNGMGVPIRCSNTAIGAVSVRWTAEGEPFFDFTSRSNQLRGLTYMDMIHLAYQETSDGVPDGGSIGVSPIMLHREAVALSIATERFAASFFRNGAKPSLALETEKSMNDEVFNRLRQQVEANYSGLPNMHKVMILEMGLKLKQISSTNVDSQLTEIRKEQAVQHCIMYGMPPHKIGILDRATNNNIEHQGIDYVTGPVSSKAKALEEALNLSLLTDVEREEFYFEHNLDALHRGDLLSRYRAYAIGRQWGWLNVDEIRDYENRNPLPDDAGKTYLQPLNMTKPGAGSKDDTPDDARDDDKKD
ncbi:MAG: phage portal protein [Ferrovibrio sp.]|nr:phage portal protein [Ferrovibrio sp.]